MGKNFTFTLFSLLMCLSTFFYPSSCTSKPDCTNVVCPQPLDCNPPKTWVILPDPENTCCNITECICEGTDSRQSFSGSHRHHYDKFFRRYINCTLVDGNLEITQIIEDAEDGLFTLDVTKHIRSVNGYVIITQNTVRHIDLSSLRLIRGRTLYNNDRTTEEVCKFVKPDDTTGNALYIYGNNGQTAGLESVDLRSLTEISKGDVSISNNNKLCYVDTIEWEREIIRDESQKVVVQNVARTCTKCSNSCITEGVDDVARCWGPTPKMCQQYTKMPCGYCTASGCVAKKTKEGRSCCLQSCRGGCVNDMCYFCKIVSDFGKCRDSATCPNGEKTDDAGTVIRKDPNEVRYRLSEYCVKKCPDNLRILEDSKTCVAVCPENYYEVEGFCKPCTGDKCAHICYGLDTTIGNLKQYDYIHSGNIGNFSKNCTIIKGSLTFRRTSFEGIADVRSINNSDSHCSIAAMSETLLDVFENVEVITGYLNIESWPLENLCTFKNLRKIEGLKQLHDSRFSLVIMTNEQSLRELCLNSLEEISSGSVAIVDNRRLCHARDINWKDIIFLSPEQFLHEDKNKNSTKCRACNKYCNESDGCWGSGSDQCLTCKYYTDYTDANGKFASEWIYDKESNSYLPGHNVTRVYATEDRKCFPCHKQCNKTCSGPHPTNCTGLISLYSHGCKNVSYNGVCQDHCPPAHYANGSNVCLKCDPGCIDGSCTGPEKKYGTNGCKECYMVYDQETERTIYHGATCLVCRTELQDLNCGKGCTHQKSTGEYKCYYEGNALVWIAPVSTVIVILLLAIGIIWFKCRTALKTMRKHIGQKFVEDRLVTDDFNTPLSPTGQPPNQAQLRIVKQSDLTLGKELGSGAFGAVYKAVWAFAWKEHTIKIPVAVKKLKTCSNSNEILEEAHVMASVDSPYLIRLLGLCVSENVSLITQLMPLGSLLDYVRNNMETIGSRHMLTWCTQIAKGMQYLEDKHMVHRDLAARNVLVKTPHHVKITDFGLSKILDVSQSVYLAEGGKLPIKWLAIECIRERKFSHQSDVWSFGVTCWEIFTFGTRPYDGVRAVDVSSLLERGDRLKQPPICTIDVYMLLVKCWLVDPLQRPRFSQLVEEFKLMSNDYSRYLVIQNDDTFGLLSPNPEDEKHFFERLVQEDTMGIDDELAFEEPDTYLLRHGFDDQPEYENLPSVPLHTNNGTAGGTSHEMRLFSRNTPSAQLATPQPQSSSNSFARSTSRLRESDSSNPDDVFMNSGHGLHNKKAPAVDVAIPEKPQSSQVRFDPTSSSVWFEQSRKDSEENSRYTEDPTTRNRSSYIEPTNPANVKRDMLPSESADGMRYDEEEYLLPTPSRKGGKKDYFDSKNEACPKQLKEESPDMGMALSNNVYMDGNEMVQSQQSHPSSWSNQFLSKDDNSSDPLYVNDQVPDHDYLNLDSQGDQSDKVPLNPNPEPGSLKGSPESPRPANEDDLDYLNSDVIVRDPGNNFVQADLSTQALPYEQQSQNHSNTLFLARNGKPKSNGLEHQLDPLLAQDNDYSTSPNCIMGLDNPEYMMLQGSTNEKDALLNDDTSEA